MNQGLAVNQSPGRPPNPKAREERRRLILHAARMCFIEEGFAAAPISKIAGRAGVSIANIYQYFSSKQDLIEELVRDSFALDIEKIKLLSLTGFEASNLKGYVTKELSKNEHVQAVKLRQEILSEATRNSKIAELLIKAEDETAMVMMEVLEEGKLRGLLPSHLCVEKAAQNMLIFHAGIATRLAIAPDKRTQLAKRFAELIDQALNQEQSEAD